MPAAAAPVDWSSRPGISALSPLGMAAFIDRAQVRAEGLLFTATPADELDEIGRWQQIQDQAWAAQCRAIVASVNRGGRRAAGVRR